MKNTLPIYSISLPEYSVDKEPDFAIIGSKLDNILRSNFKGKWIAVRGISSKDHPKSSADELISLIIKLGTDRYDPARKGVQGEWDKLFGIDLHAIPVLVQEDLYCPHYNGERCITGSVIGELLSDCYGGAVVDRGYALRLDILMIFDLNQLKAAPMEWKENGPVHSDRQISPQETCEFQFKHPDKKPEALIGIIKIES